MFNRNSQRLASFVTLIGIAAVYVVQAQSAPVPAGGSVPDGTDVATDSGAQTAGSIGGAARWSAAGHDLS
ncbi:MAG TPA: hypothetical protein VGI70_14870, partial [Polyangiales bacterium]